LPYPAFPQQPAISPELGPVPLASNRDTAKRASPSVSARLRAICLSNSETLSARVMTPTGFTKQFRIFQIAFWGYATLSWLKNVVIQPPLGTPLGQRAENSDVMHIWCTSGRFQSSVARNALPIMSKLITIVKGAMNQRLVDPWKVTLIQFPCMVPEEQ